MKEDATITIDLLVNHLSVSKNTIKRNISDLKESGRIERIGSPRAGTWKVND